jgi:hypothetical protein
MTATDIEPRAAAVPVPPGRGRWRVTLHRRSFTTTAVYPSATGIAELPHARARTLTQAWDAPATFAFTVDGHSPAAAYIAELATDVIAWRWDEASGTDIPMFRGPICQAQDTIDEDSHAVTFTAHDYLALLARRYITGPSGYGIVGTDQDTIAATLVRLATGQVASGGPNLTPGSYLPVTTALVNPDGTARAAAGILRDRTYAAGTEIGQALDELAKVAGGFDYDLSPRSDLAGFDTVRLFYPAQGVNRTGLALVYGSTVSTVQRSVDSGVYGNYWRVIGNNGSADPAALQLFGQAYNSDASSGTAGAVGTWMSVDNAADVTIQSTLDAQAAGDLNLNGILVPAYQLGLTPGWYTWGNPNMGDTVGLVVQSGRLNVSTTVRVVAITYNVGDDGQEDVALTVGRPVRDLSAMFTQADRDVNALTRR